MNSFKYVILIAFFFGIGSGKFLDPEPLPEDAAEQARYIVHKSDWVSVGTKSSLDAIKGYPFASLKSMADGPVENGTGVPYMYVTNIDITMKDLNVDNSCTLFLSLAEGSYCQEKSLDPQEPGCVRVMLTGNIEKLDDASEEGIFGKNALFSRHPSMKFWPKDHLFYVIKINIKQVALINEQGFVTVTPEDYYNAKV